jgi:hypothetical protein
VHKRWYFSSQSLLCRQKYIDEAQKTKLEQFNFDLIDNLNLDKS